MHILVAARWLCTGHTVTINNSWNESDGHDYTILESVHRRCNGAVDLFSVPVAGLSLLLATVYNRWLCKSARS